MDNIVIKRNEKAKKDKMTFNYYFHSTMFEIILMIAVIAGNKYIKPIVWNFLIVTLIVCLIYSIWKTFNQKIDDDL